MRKKPRQTNAELNITAFMNLMVVLIPFLLIEAVFTYVSIIRLDLPSDEPVEMTEENIKPFILEILIYKNRYELVDRQSETVLRVVRNRGEQHDIRSLHRALKNLKEISRESKAEVRSLTILCEDDTPYELLISTMDAARIMEVNVNGQMIKRELFPEISIGSAPPDGELSMPGTEGDAA